MKLTTKGHYGFHALIELARRRGSEPVMIREIARRWGISEKYLEQILRLLRQAGLVESARGAGGGFWLARPAAEIKAIEILAALEEKRASRSLHASSKRSRPFRCAVEEVWEAAEKSARQCWEQKTLAELAERQDLLDGLSGKMDYVI